jgi:hypothetical protein
VISALRFDHSTFAAASHGGSIARKKRRVGAKLSYNDSQAATTTFTVLKRARGVKHGKKCVKPPRHKGKKKLKRCKRNVSVGAFRHNDKAGANKFRFTGRVHGHKLRPGRYSLRAVASFAGHKGKPKTKGFRIVR